MSTPSLSHRLSAFTSLLSGTRKDDLRGIFCGSPFISRNFTVRFVSREFTESSKWGRLSIRQSPAVIPKRGRSISNDVRVRSSQNEHNADLDPLGGGDKLVRVISKDAEVSVLSLVATEVVREAQQRHNTSPTACAALGRTLMGTLLLGALKGDAETVQVLFRGNGPLGNMTAISADEGHVKGFVVNPSCDPPLKDNGKLNVGLAVGSGVLSVVRNNRNWKQPYTGTVPIYSGEIAEDIAHYLADSEQMNTALGLGIGFDKEVGIRFAGGYLVQRRPYLGSKKTSSK
uniref:Uncharacterized protein n=1 Tax=Physcomitrium patens TaxID=3218 RepID=A0A7I4DAL1_PHYPA